MGSSEWPTLPHIHEWKLITDLISDIIDTCSWKSRVRKMLLGSLLPYEDQKNTDEDSVPRPVSPMSPTTSTSYDPQLLNKLFEDFNRGRLHTVVPHSAPPPSPNTASPDPSRTESRRVDTESSFLSTETRGKFRKNISGYLGSPRGSRHSP